MAGSSELSRSMAPLYMNTYSSPSFGPHTVIGPLHQTGFIRGTPGNVNPLEGGKNRFVLHGIRHATKKHIGGDIKALSICSPKRKTFVWVSCLFACFVALLSAHADGWAGQTLFADKSSGNKGAAWRPKNIRHRCKTVAARLQWGPWHLAWPHHKKRTPTFTQVTHEKMISVTSKTYISVEVTFFISFGLLCMPWKLSCSKY